jgi:hypothetical protein
VLTRAVQRSASGALMLQGELILFRPWEYSAGATDCGSAMLGYPHFFRAGSFLLAVK